MNKTYYVVLCEYSIDADMGVEIIGVKEDYKEAEELYKKRLEEERRAAQMNGYNCVKEAGTCFVAYIDGEYTLNHVNLYIAETKDHERG